MRTSSSSPRASATSSTLSGRFALTFTLALTLTLTLAPNLSRNPIYLTWQEDWTSNPFARSKFIKGKLVYQRDPAVPAYYARPYGYRDGVLHVPADATEEAVADVLPCDAIKLGCIEV